MRILALLLFVVSLASCDVTKTDFPVRTEAVQTQVGEMASNVAVVRLSADNIAAFNTPRDLHGSRTTVPPAGGTYKIGVGDILDIVIWDHPELTQPTGAPRSPQDAGMRVQADGTFFYPYVGQVTARGRTPVSVREDLTRRLAEFIPDPQIEVRVVGFKSQAVSVTGQVGAARRQPLTDTPLTLLDAIDAAGGLTTDADPRKVILRRGGHGYNVDMQAFLEQGIAENNPVLQNGDVVSVPKLEPQEAYILGQIAKPSTVDLTRENVTLTQALTRVWGLHEDQADARGIFVFRDTPMGINVYQLDASNPMAFLIGTRFVILPKDVIYVTTAPLYRWNRLISSLLPSVTSARLLDVAAAG